MTADNAEPIGIELKFVGADDLPVLFANSFAMQSQHDEFVLTAAQLVPPVFLGTPEEQREQARELDHVPVRVVTRLALTPGRLRELTLLLVNTLKQYEDRVRSND